MSVGVADPIREKLGNGLRAIDCIGVKAPGLSRIPGFAVNAF
jgi:hypothetical protein